MRPARLRAFLCISLLAALPEQARAEAQRPPTDVAVQQLPRRAERAADLAGQRRPVERFVAQARRRPVGVRIGRQSNVQLQQQHATEALDAALDGQLDAALDALGEYADLPRSPQTFFGEPPYGAALANIVRLASRLGADERFELWKKWTLPDQDRQAVRILCGLTAPNRAPKAFRRLAFADRDPAERGRAPVAIPEVISTVDLLIDSARQAQRLDELATTLQKLVEDRIERAGALAALVSLARGSENDMTSFIRQQIDVFRKRSAAAEVGLEVTPRENWLLARACLARGGELQLLGEQHLRQIIERVRQMNLIYQLPILYHDLYQSQARRAALAGLTNPGDPGLELWHPASHAAADRRKYGELTPWWVAHDNVLASLGGYDFDLLYFDYPLAGDFDFSMEALDGDWDECSVSYAGMIFEALHGTQVPWIYAVGFPEWFVLPETVRRRGEFNMITLQVRGSYVRCLLNGHIMHEIEDATPASPWLSLYVPQSYRAVVRNPRLTGDVRIPREVALCAGDRLEGWITRFYGETQPRRRQAAGAAGALVAPAVDDAVWTSREGVISGRQLPAPEGAIRQSRMIYHRPLRVGETVRYEFLYEPGQTEVHPALDRLAFLLTPDGVHVHWMTDNNEIDPWNGLPADNVVTEPEFRRGPRQIPLRAGQWNQVRLSLHDDRAVLELNDVEIYSRPLEPDNDRLFGLYHNSAGTSAQVRGVVLSGNWPGELTAAHRTGLFASRVVTSSAAECRARHAAIGERFFAMNWENVQREASGQPARKRYEFLKAWVLPTADHPTYRVIGGMTPTNPPPAGAARPSVVQPGSGIRVASGGAITAPALDLVATAKDLDKLGELQALVEQTPGETSCDRRGQLALQTIIALARSDNATATTSLQKLRLLIDKADAKPPDENRFPEYLTAWTTLQSPALRRSAVDLVEAIGSRDVERAPPLQDDLLRSVLHGHAWFLSEREHGTPVVGTNPLLKQWAVVTHATAQSQSSGMPAPYWHIASGLATHIAGHPDDSLYFQSPLRGIFEVSCRLSPVDRRNLRISYGDTYLGVSPSQSGMVSYRGRGAILHAFDPPVANLGDSFDFRLKIQNDRYSAFVNDRKLHEEQLPAGFSPWLVVRAPSVSGGSVRDLRISGSPSIPEDLNLSESTDLTGWITDYFGQQIGKNGPDWITSDGEITGRKNGEIVAGSRRQSLLRYRRPLLEDGELEYEFFYEQDEAHVHPMLDRLTFLLERNGVRLHWLTDAQYDRTELPHDNATEEPANRRGPEKLNLEPQSWNRVKLALSGNDVSLALNGVEIYRRSLEATNQRTFGLFHYADQTEARVRRIHYRGKWPRALPSVAAQELSANPAIKASKP